VWKGEDNYVIVKIDGVVPHFVLTVGLGSWVMGTHSFWMMGGYAWGGFVGGWFVFGLLAIVIFGWRFLRSYGWWRV